MNPESAVRYLVEMSSDVREAMVADKEGEIVAATLSDATARAGELIKELLRLMPKSNSKQRSAEGLELATSTGQVFLVSGDRYSVVAIAGRSPVPAVVLFDMRVVLGDLEQGDVETEAE